MDSIYNKEIFWTGFTSLRLKSYGAAGRIFKIIFWFFLISQRKMRKHNPLSAEN